MNAYIVYSEIGHGEYIGEYWCITERDQVWEVVYDDTAEAAIARFERRYDPYTLTGEPMAWCEEQNVKRQRRGFAGKRDPLWQKAFAVIDSK